MSLFTQRVVDVVKNIPEGSTMSYKEVATRAGNPGASRAVGTIMKRNRDKTVPCHRVIRSNGTYGSYNFLRGMSKETLLQKEGYVHQRKTS